MMAANLYTALAGDTNPYENLAMESCLVEAAPADGVILYLWQNRRTVVIGKNQNAWSECRVEHLERDGGFLARRPSGGGAVFHDLGNLNFSFIAKTRHYNVERQLDILISAVASLGINAKRSGRNDVLVDGRKFSGNAFLQKGDNFCHHGTIMVNVSTDQLSKYLDVSALKLKSKGVESVESRVCNLVDLRSNTTVDEVKAAMLSAFDKIYGGVARPLPEEMKNGARLLELTKLYASWEWRLGRKIPFAIEMRHRFDWGEVTLLLKVTAGVVEDAMCYSDSLDIMAIEGVADKLTGSHYSQKAFMEVMLAHAQENKEREDKLIDMAKWLAEEEL